MLHGEKLYYRRLSRRKGREQSGFPAPSRKGMPPLHRNLLTSKGRIFPFWPSQKEYLLSAPACSRPPQLLMSEIAILRQLNRRADFVTWHL